MPPRHCLFGTIEMVSSPPAKHTYIKLLFSECPPSIVWMVWHYMSPNREGHFHHFTGSQTWYYSPEGRVIRMVNNRCLHTDNTMSLSPLTSFESPSPHTHSLSLHTRFPITALLQSFLLPPASPCQEGHSASPFHSHHWMITRHIISIYQPGQWIIHNRINEDRLSNATLGDALHMSLTCLPRIVVQCHGDAPPVALGNEVRLHNRSEKQECRR